MTATERAQWLQQAERGYVLLSQEHQRLEGGTYRPGSTAAALDSALGGLLMAVKELHSEAIVQSARYCRPTTTWSRIVAVARRYWHA